MKLFPMLPFITAVSSAIVSFANVTATTNDWENPAVNSRLRLPARAYSMPLESEAAAKVKSLEFPSPWVLSLNGQWRIKWVGDPARRPADFYREDFDDSKWEHIDVPACVEMRGFGSPGYVNVLYPHANAFPKILDRDTGRPDYNPVSSYRRHFELPAAWAGRRVILRFEGVGAAYYVWINGKLAGYAEDSKLPSEFDITELANIGKNQLAVQVFRWCDGSYLEDQDMFRFSGIFRDVSVWSMPFDGIWDFQVNTKPLGDYSHWQLKVEFENGDSASLYDDNGEKVGDLAKVSSSKFELNLKPRLWSAETPTLYTLVLRKGADIRAKRIGFKEQKIADHTFVINNQAVKLKGVNRHETSPKNGRTVSLDDMMTDITMMKRYNFNCVRTSHYPNHRQWYDLCDRYGIYVIAEANVEGHEPGYGEGSLGLKPELDQAIVERNERQVVFYRNNVSIIMWSAGNETGHGPCFSHAIATIRKLDASRIVHWERGNAEADVESSMYPDVEWVEKRGELGDVDDERDMKSADGGIGFAGSTHTAGKPYIMCEYAHAMGNAVGNFAEYWEAIYRHRSLIGGCIWDWADQSIWKATGRRDSDFGHELIFAYGGDFDEFPNNGPFCNNGLVNPIREVSDKLLEVAHVQRNIVVRQVAPRRFTLENRFDFIDLSGFTGKWELMGDGDVVASQDFQPPCIAPHTIADLELPALTAALASLTDGREYFVNFTFTTAADSPLVPKGWVIARDQHAIVAPPCQTRPIKTSPVKVERSSAGVKIAAGDTLAQFRFQTGTLSLLSMGGKVILDDRLTAADAAGPRLTLARAFTDNDVWMLKGDPWGEDRTHSFEASGLMQLKYHPEPFEVDADNGTVKAVVDVAGAKGCGFIHTAWYRFNKDGGLSISNRVEAYGAIPRCIPRLGLTLILSPELESMRWYGRGPGENYVDRNSASFIGRYESTVTDQFVPYIRPQDCGSKSDVRWLEMFDAHLGGGVRFGASQPLFTQALHFTWEDLEFSRHRSGQRRFYAPPQPHEEIYLNLDVLQMGLGGGSCGPGPMAKYQLDLSKPIDWEVFLTCKE